MFRNIDEKRAYDRGHQDGFGVGILLAWSLFLALVLLIFLMR